MDQTISATPGVKVASRVATSPTCPMRSLPPLFGWPAGLAAVCAAVGGGAAAAGLLSAGLVSAGLLSAGLAAGALVAGAAGGGCWPQADRMVRPAPVRS